MIQAFCKFCKANNKHLHHTKVKKTNIEVNFVFTFCGRDAEFPVLHFPCHLFIVDNMVPFEHRFAHFAARFLVNLRAYTIFSQSSRATGSAGAETM
jgi:hypothetical protein